jgi:hypothetical protein
MALIPAGSNFVNVAKNDILNGLAPDPGPGLPVNVFLASKRKRHFFLNEMDPADNETSVSYLHLHELEHEAMGAGGRIYYLHFCTKYK